MSTVLIYVLTGLCVMGLSYAALSIFSAAAIAYNGEYSKEASRKLEDMFLFIPPKRIMEISWIVALCVAVLTMIFLGGVVGSAFEVLVRLIVSIVVGGLSLLLPGRAIVILRNRRRKKFNLQLVDALVNMSNALKSGFSIMQAMENVVENGESPISEEFETMLHQTRVGVAFQDALNNMDRRVGSEDLTLVVMAIETARRTGGNLTEVFETISHTIRERIRIETRINTLTAQGRLQGIILSLMPIGIGVLLNFLEPGLFGVFMKSMVGVCVMCAIAILLALGAYFIRKIVKIDI